jgi:hypothetical protein
VRVQHRPIEIGRREPGVGGQVVPQRARHDAGARGGLQHRGRLAGGGAARNVGGIVGEDDRAHVPIVVLRNAADEGCVAAHDRLWPIGGRT